MNAYTYLIGWSIQNKFYYGCQFGKKADPGNLWETYFTSSRHVKAFRTEHGEPDIIEVRKIFGKDDASCRLWEERVLTKLMNRRDGLWLNRRATSGKWFTRPGHGSGIPKSEEHKAKIRASHIGKVNAIDVRTGQRARVSKQEFHENPVLVGTATGRTRNAEQRKQMSDAHKGRTIPDETRKKISKSLMGRDLGKIIPEEQRAKISASLKGRVYAKNKITGEKVCVTSEEFKANGDLVGQSAGKGTAHSAETKKKIGESQRGFFTAIDITTGQFVKVTREEFKSNQNLRGSRYRGHLPSIARW
jgi:hypothetical protein